MTNDAKKQKSRVSAGYSPISISHNAHYAGNQELRDPLDAKAWMTPRVIQSPPPQDNTPPPQPAHRDPLDPKAWHDGRWMKGRESTLNASGSLPSDDRSTIRRQRLPDSSDVLKVKPVPTSRVREYPFVENAPVSLGAWLWGPAEMRLPVFRRKIFWLVLALSVFVMGWVQYFVEDFLIFQGVIG